MFAFYDMNKSFNMFTSLVEEFKKNSNDVYVVAPRQDEKATAISREKGIDILRVKTLPLKNVSNWEKGVSNLLLPYQYRKAINKFYPNVKFDLIVLPTPPITLVNLAAFLKKRYRAKIYLMLRDIFPQNAIDLGFMKKDSFVYKYFRKKEKKLYQIADYIGCMSQGNIDYVLCHNPEILSSKMHELKNFQYVYQGFGFDRNFLREKYKLTGKFVLVFGGNMGKPQQLENVLELAIRAMKYPDVLFLLLGEGTMMDRIASKIKELKITNIRIQNKIPKQEYQDLINVCDVGIISLHQDFTIPNIPSKTLDYFNVGLPVLASIDRATDYNTILDDINAGLWSYAGEHDQFFKNFEIIYLNSELRKQMGINGQNYHRTYLTPQVAYETVYKQISK